MRSPFRLASPILSDNKHHHQRLLNQQSSLLNPPTTATAIIPPTLSNSCPYPSSSACSAANRFTRRLSALQLLCVLLLPLFLWVQFVPTPQTSRLKSRIESIRLSFPFSPTSFYQIDDAPDPFPTQQCAAYPDLFTDQLPVCKPHKMALVEEAKRVAAEFEYTTADLNKGVKEYINQMKEGLSKQDATLAQIPTYVTAVPNGTEKVCQISRLQTNPFHECDCLDAPRQCRRITSRSGLTLSLHCRAFIWLSISVARTSVFAQSNYTATKLSPSRNPRSPFLAS